MPSGIVACENGAVRGAGQVWVVLEGSGVAAEGRSGKMVCLDAGDGIRLDEGACVCLAANAGGSLVLLCHRME